MRYRRTVSGAVAALGIIGAVTADGAVRRVNIASSYDSGADGSSWANAYTFLADAIDDAAAGDVIWIAGGTYFPHHVLGGGGQPAPGTNRAATFEWPWRVSIQGGYFGHDSNDELRDPELYPTILSGNIGSAGLDTDNSKTVVTLGPNPYDQTTWDWDFELSGVTIEAGYATDPGIGGGMTAASSEAYPLVQSCIIAGNRNVYDVDSARGGGGVHVDGTGTSGDANHLLFRQCAFRENTSVEPGGAVAVMTHYDSRVSFVACTFEDNVSDGTGQYEGCGGAIHFDDAGGENPSTTEMVNCTFRGNSATQGGGAISAKIHAGIDGVVSLRLVNCLLDENSSGGPGGAVYNIGVDAEVLNCTIVENTATGAGGAWYESDSTPATHDLSFANTILHGNTSSGGSTANQIHNTNPGALGTFTVTSCLVEDGLDGISGTDPDVYASNLSGSADPGFVDAPGDLYALLAASPCVDAGSNAAVPCDRFDLDGDAIDCAAGENESVPYDIRALSTCRSTARIRRTSRSASRRCGWRERREALTARKDGVSGAPRGRRRRGAFGMHRGTPPVAHP